MKVKVILGELCVVDKNLINVGVTNNIESDSEFLYDNIRKRQALIEWSKSLRSSDMEGASFEAGKEVTDAVLKRLEMLINSMINEGFSEMIQ